MSTDGSAVQIELTRAAERDLRGSLLPIIDGFDRAVGTLK